MSNERPSKNNRMHRAARSFKGKLSSLLNLSRSPTPSSIDVGSSFDNHTIAMTDAGTSNLPLNMAPVVGIDHAPVESTEAYIVPAPISVPVSATMPAVPSQLVSVSSSGPELETSMVSIMLRSRSSSLNTAHLADVSEHP
ncbi:hypothetical protein BYT27DRAFT_6373108 [Phlegmacium glaucopus]|nr:hypothetical protein BYT27DRAFT_6373108 [Phlegmacium glaucopus]